jgi:predicted hydrolase (HD superfamily)
LLQRSNYFHFNFNIKFSSTFTSSLSWFQNQFGTMSLHLGRSVFGNINNTGNIISQADALDIFNTWVLNPKLKLHMQQVAYLMKCWAAEKLHGDESLQWKWEVAGLLHDADWDQWPELHCKKIIEELESRNIDPEIIRAIASHGHVHFGVIPETEMDKMLYAFDELSGLIHAYSLMRPTGYESMDVKGVKKRLKEKSFAANVSREDIQDACTRANVELDDLIAFIIPRQTKITQQLI